MAYTYYGGTSERDDYFGGLIEPDFSEESPPQPSGGQSRTPSPAPLSYGGPSVTDGQRGLSDDLMTPDFGDEVVYHSPDDVMEPDFDEDEDEDGLVYHSPDDVMEPDFEEEEDEDEVVYHSPDDVMEPDFGGDGDEGGLVYHSPDDVMEPDFEEEEDEDEDDGVYMYQSSPDDVMEPDFDGDGQSGGGSSLFDEAYSYTINGSSSYTSDQTTSQSGGSDGGPATLPLPDAFAGETRDASVFRGGPGHWQGALDREHGGAGQGPRLDAVRTRYFDQQEQAQSEISVQDGLLRQQGGDLMDTTQASGTGTFMGSGQGKHIFTLTPEGQVRATDPWASKQINTVGQNEAHPNAPAGATSLDFVNHSSLVAGGSVAGAGELTVGQGQLQQIGDGSGHYRPGGQQMHQTLEHFQSQGVDTHDTGMRFVGKSQGQRPLIASAREFQAQDNPAMAENAMRTRRANLSDELRRTVTSREQRLGIQNEERTNY